MSYKELLKQVGVTTAVVAVASVSVQVGLDQWHKYQAKKAPPPLPSPYGGNAQKTPEKQPVGGSLENSPCSEQTAAFLTCAFHQSADLVKCAQLAENLKSCRKMYKLEPEGGPSWIPWK